MATRYSRQTGYTMTARNTARTAMRAQNQKRVRLGPTTAKLFGLLALAILAIVMISQSSGRATNVYDQNEIRKQTSAAEQDVDRMKLEAQRAQSLQAVQNSAVKDKLETVKEVQYLEKGDVAGVATEKKSE